MYFLGGFFSWTPVSYATPTNPLTFYAADSRNETSRLVVITEMCGCENGGGCNFETLVIDQADFRVN